MMLNYHPTIEMLTDYAAGSLPLTYSLAVSTHLEQCQECQQHVRKLELLGANLFTKKAPDQQTTDTLKQTFFDKLNAEVEANTAAQTMASTLEDTEKAPLDGYCIPRSLRQFVSRNYDELSWMRLSPAVKIATLCEEDGVQVALTRIKAGAHIPTHTHAGEEITLVLEGAFSDEKGIYSCGDFVSRNAKHKHKPRVTKDAECICLTVLDAPIEFTGWLTRFLNPIMRRHHPSTQRG
ncbi:ChrR family anti-sigma-E factor [Marinomonas arenicola]|uniref:ChrR family anti-sigma-E factor n=1 Tax=Marinomonas TaxID=28253 RepID=UPI001FB849B0|nr:ChrR family anti-sigma-E factor [Marinomonas sp. KMM3893]